MRRERKHRLAVLWTEFPPYLAGCLKVLEAQYSVELLVVSNLGHRDLQTRRPFPTSPLSGFRHVEISDDSAVTRARRIRSVVSEFAPTAVLLAFQWRLLEYFPLVAWMRRRGVFVVGAMDNAWFGGLRQELWSSFLRATRALPLNAIWVPGERAAQYAQRLFPVHTHVWRGLYCADSDLFGRAGEAQRTKEKQFLFVGRFAAEKGISDLVRAYGWYRKLQPSPWPLECVGDGALRRELEGQDGVSIRGFSNPADVAERMSCASAFVLPSRFEPWGVVLHEAALAGMPIVCSDACGAAVEMVQQQYNGLVFRPGDVEGLAGCLREISEVPSLDSWGRHSASLGNRLTTDVWCRILMAGLEQEDRCRAR